MRRSHRFLLIAICATAGLLRVWHIDFGLPHDFHPDEPQIITTSLSMVTQQDLHPHFFTWPGLVFYLNALLYSGFFLVGKIVGFFPSVAELRAFELLDRSVFILISRLLSAFFGSLSVIALFVFGRNLGHTQVGLVAAAVLAVSPLHVRHSHFGTVDIALTFFILVATYFLYVSCRQQRKRDFILVGVAAGLATATKYPAGLLLIACVLLSPLLVAKEGQPLWSRSFLLSIRSFLVLSVGAFILSYSLAAPYTYLDFPAFWHSFSWHSGLMSQGWLGSEGISSYFGYYAKLLLVNEWGIVTGFLCLIGTGLLAFQSLRTALVLSTFPVLYYGFFGWSATGFARFALPLVPAVALLAAYALWQISRLA